MAGQVYPCAVCGAKKYASELVWSNEKKDFVCKDKEVCYNSDYARGKIKRRNIIA